MKLLLQALLALLLVHPLILLPLLLHLALLTLLLLLEVWGINSFSWFTPGALGSRLLRSLLSVGFTALLAVVVWEACNAAIARRLYITEKSVVAHTSGIYDTLGLPTDGDEHRRVLAVIHYLGR